MSKPHADSNSPASDVSDLSDVSGVSGVSDQSDVSDDSLTSPPRDRKTLPHWILLAICCAVLGLSLLLDTRDSVRVTLPGTDMALPALCTMKRTVGWDCPGCGMTRTFILISHGQWDRAMGLNPAGFLLYAFVAIQIPYRLWQIARIRRGRPAINDQWAIWFLLVFAFILLAQWLIRLVVVWL